MHDVVIVGAGPTGMMLAAELALAGVDVVIVERRASQNVDGSRASGLHSRTLEVLDQRGVADRFIDAGQAGPTLAFSQVSLDVSDLPTRHGYVLALWQGAFEPILAGWIGELGVPVLRGSEVVGFTQDDDGVDVALADGQSLRAAYLVGCDGGHSLIRAAAGIDFVGTDASTSWLIAEVELAEEPRFGLRAGGGIGRAADGLRVRLALPDEHLKQGRDPGLDDVSAALIAVDGTDYGLRSASWISRFTDLTRQAAAYRHGRVLLAGDAAHVHPPHGGQGLNTGVQDAVNLGWKLAQVVKGASPDRLLDTYQAERQPVGARVLHTTMAQVALLRQDPRQAALREIVTGFLAMAEPRRQVVGMLSGLDIRYDLGDGHPLLGRRMPDLDLHTADGPLRLYSLLHDARPLLLNCGAAGAVGVVPRSDRVRLVDARHDGVWELPVIGTVSPPTAVLIRPDGYVAWVGEQTDDGLGDALRTWF